MGDSYAVPALQRKRTDLAREIVATEHKLRDLRLLLRQVDTVIRLFDPDTPRMHGTRRSPLLPDLIRHILDVLRRAPEPLTSWEIARGVVDQNGLPLTRMKGIDKSIRKCLRRQDGKLVERVGDMPARWKVA